MDLAGNLDSIQHRIRAACERSRRPVDSVRLLAVTKDQPPERVAEAAALGLTLFGESRVQHGKSKIPLCPPHLTWHMIGHLQSNKTRDAVHWFSMIESVDTLELAADIDRWSERQAKLTPILLEVNVAGEATKHGFKPDQILDQLDDINRLPRIAIHGLMTIAPWTADPEKARAHFQQLRALKEQCEQRLGAPLPHLSMGMSGDFEVAIEEGSTLIRIGTALFGARASRLLTPSPAAT